MKISRYSMLHSGDVVMVEFGTSSVRSHVQGRHPALIVGEESSSRDRFLLVIPMFKSKSRSFGEKDIRIRKHACDLPGLGSGLHRDMNVNPTNIQKIERCRSVSFIGHLRDDDLYRKIVESVCGEVGADVLPQQVWQGCVYQG